MTPRTPAPARLRAVLLPVALLSMAACSYGPEETRVRVEQIVGPPDSYVRWVVVRHDRFRSPTGLLNTFPNGGVVRFLERRAHLHRVEAGEGSSEELARLAAPDSLWVSFGARVTGIVGDSVAWLMLTGCPRGGECWGDLVGRRIHRVDADGTVRRVPDMPPGVGLPAARGGRRVGETRFVRMDTSGDTLRARLSEDGPRHPLFRVRPDGSLEPLAPEG